MKEKKNCNCNLKAEVQPCGLARLTKKQQQANHFSEHEQLLPKGVGLGAQEIKLISLPIRNTAFVVQFFFPHHSA